MLDVTKWNVSLIVRVATQVPSYTFTPGLPSGQRLKLDNPTAAGIHTHYLHKIDLHSSRCMGDAKDQGHKCSNRSKALLVRHP